MVAAGTAASWGSDDARNLSPPWPFSFVLASFSSLFFSRNSQVTEVDSSSSRSTVAQPNISNEERAPFNPIVPTKVPELSPIGVVGPSQNSDQGGGMF